VLERVVRIFIVQRGIRKSRHVAHTISVRFMRQEVVTRGITSLDLFSDGSPTEFKNSNHLALMLAVRLELGIVVRRGFYHSYHSWNAVDNVIFHCLQQFAVYIDRNDRGLRDMATILGIMNSMPQTTAEVFNEVEEFNGTMERFDGVRSYHFFEFYHNGTDWVLRGRCFAPPYAGGRPVGQMPVDNPMWSWVFRPMDMVQLGLFRANVNNIH